jgi:hypothetical protein
MSHIYFIIYELNLAHGTIYSMTYDLITKLILLPSISTWAFGGPHVHLIPNNLHPKYILILYLEVSYILPFN